MTRPPYSRLSIQLVNTLLPVSPLEVSNSVLSSGRASFLQTIYVAYCQLLACFHFARHSDAEQEFLLTFELNFVYKYLNAQCKPSDIKNVLEIEKLERTGMFMSSL